MLGFLKKEWTTWYRQEGKSWEKVTPKKERKQSQVTQREGRERGWGWADNYSVRDPKKIYQKEPNRTEWKNLEKNKRKKGKK